MRRNLSTALSLLLLATAPACSQSGTGPQLPGEADVRILFIGNSLTYTHDVPRLVRALAERDGRVLATATIAHPNYSLEDHWHSGIAGEIRRLSPDIVVMQQGPSSLPENRLHLVGWSQELAAVIRDAGAQPALYMVWPDASRRSSFADVEASYAAAAEAVGGRLLPAGTTWLMAWERDPDLQLYGADGFHPSYLGALAAAHTIYAGLFEVDPAAVPALGDNVSEARLKLLREAVSASLLKWQR